MHTLYVLFAAAVRALEFTIEHAYAFLLAYVIVRKFLPDRYARAVDTAFRLVNAAVLARQSVVRDLKNPDKPGTWNPTTAKAVRDAAVREAELMLGPQAGVLHDELVKQGAPETDLRAFLGSLVESSVEAQRRAAVPATIAPAAPTVATASVTVALPTPAAAEGAASAAAEDGEGAASAAAGVEVKSVTAVAESK